jgi:hypothetical protein
MIPERALEIATAAHAGQVDKVGRDYIHHPVSVAARLRDPDAVVVALLHDVLEDTAVTSEDLRAAGITDEQLLGVETLTHADDVDDETYWRSVRSVPLARVVKIADVTDNTAPDRFADLEPPTADRLRAKYRRAMGVLLWDETAAGPVRPGDWDAFVEIVRPSLATLGVDVLDPPG